MITIDYFLNNVNKKHRVRETYTRILHKISLYVICPVSFHNYFLTVFLTSHIDLSMITMVYFLYNVNKKQISSFYVSKNKVKCFGVYQSLKHVITLFLN